MPTFIKTGFWEKTRKGYKEWLNLDQFVNSKLPEPTYKVYTALLTQGGDTNDQFITSGELTIGITYYIINGDGADFTNVGAPNSNEDTWFVAIGTTPNSWGTSGELRYNEGAPVPTVLENTIGNIYFRSYGVGAYSVNSNGLFISGKTYPTLQANQFDGNSNVGYYINIGGESNIDITIINSLSGPQDGWLYNTPIEIRVYN